MALSKDAKDFAQHSFCKKMDTVSFEHWKRLSQLRQKTLGSGSTYADACLDFTRRTTDAKVEAFLETCKLFDEMISDEEIDRIIQDLSEMTEGDLKSEIERTLQIQGHSGSLFERWAAFVHQARNDLRLGMKRIEMERKKNENARVNIGDNFTGAVQIGGSQNTQTVNILINTQFDNAFNKILELLQKDTHLDEYQKEDAIDALQKLPDLAKKEPSESIMKRAKEKLELITSAISVSKETAIIAAPYLLELARYFHLL